MKKLFGVLRPIEFEAMRKLLNIYLLLLVINTIFLVFITVIMLGKYDDLLTTCLTVIIFVYVLNIIFGLFLNSKIN